MNSIKAFNADVLKNILQQTLKPTVIEVRDDSAKHAGHQAAKIHGGGHYHVRIISNDFINLKQLARHRLVYAALHDYMETHIHALSIEAYAPNETKA